MPRHTNESRKSGMLQALISYVQLSRLYLKTETDCSLRNSAPNKKRVMNVQKLNDSNNRTAEVYQNDGCNLVV
jgi:hypothetical protein